MRKFGPVTIGRVRSSEDLKRLLEDPRLKTGVSIIKPNWFSPHPGNFTDAETLRTLLEALDGRIVVAESYTLERQDGSMKFTVDGAEVDWRWIMKHPSWGWIKEEGRWDEMRRQDRWFLDEYGFTDLFKEYGVEYVNVTEEVWQGRTADAREIKEAVEARLAPVFREELYSFIPKRLYELRGATLIRLFGLIPDPLRSWWHGPNNQWLGRSIVDIIKVYSALFQIYGICEALRHAIVSCHKGEVKTPWGSYDIVRDLGVLAFSRDLVSLDAVLCSLIGADPEKISYLSLGERAFGIYNRRHVEDAKMSAGNWFPVPSEKR